MEQSPSCEDESCLAGQEIPRHLWNPNIHYRVHNSAPLDFIVSQLNPVYTQIYAIS
jgi:hypothetical protein